MRVIDCGRRLSKACLFLPLGILACSQPSPGLSVTRAPLTTGFGVQYQLIPAYYDYTTDQASMDALVQSSASNGLRGVVVANFGDPGGPGDWASANATFISDLQANGVPVLGYVDSVYGRNPDYMIEEMREWNFTYGVDGVFFDDADRELTDDHAEVARMQWFLNYVRSNFSSSLLPDGPMAAFNWGTDSELEPYVFCASGSGAPSYAYLFNTFEGPETSTPGMSDGFDAYTPAPWVSSYASWFFSNLVYGASNPNTNIPADMLTARHNNAGWVYVTDGSDHKWSKLVGYFNDPTTDAYWATERSVTNGGPYGGDYPYNDVSYTYDCSAPGLELLNGDFSQDFTVYPNYGWMGSGQLAPQWDSQNQWAALGSTTSNQAGISMLAQEITVPATATTLSFWFQSGCQGSSNITALEIRNPSTGAATPLLDECVASGWQTATFDVTTWAGQDVDLVFYTDNYDGVNPDWMDVDNVQVY